MSTFEQDIDEINQFECEEVRERTLSEDEFETDTFMYERFVVDDDEAGSDIFSDCENIESSDTEYTSEHCDGQSDDMLLLALLSQVVQVLCSYYLLYSNTSLLVKRLVIYLLLLKLTSPDQTIVKQQPKSCLNL